MSVERVGIQVEVLGYEQSEQKLRELERAAKSLSGKNAKIEIDLGNGEKKITTINERIKELDKNIINLKSSIAKSSDPEEIKRMNQEIRESQAEMNRLKWAGKQAGMSLKQVFNSISSRVAHLGSAMQSMGNALTKLSSPFNNLLKGTMFGAGYKLLGLASSGLSGATERYDIMATYAPIMQSLGQDADRAEQSISNLNDAVLGLPTGLDEIVEQHKLLTIATGDLVKAEKLAIASNNAYIAGGADEAKITQAKKELQTLMQTGKLNERQWMTLQKGMPSAWNEIKQNMEDAGKIQEDFLTDLKKGTISAEEFTEALIEVGTNGKVKDAVETMKHTFSAATANVENAFKRMGTNVIKTLDEVLKAYNGKDVIDNIIGLKDVIDTISDAIQGWIKANPKVITDFMKSLSKFDVAKFTTGVLDGLANKLKVIESIIKFASKFNPSSLGKFLVMSNLLGKMLTIGGGLIKGSRHIFGGAGAGAFGLGKLLRSLTGFNGFGLGEKLKGLFSAGKAVEGMGGPERVAAAVGSLKTLAVNLGKVLLVGGAGVLSVKGIKTALNDLKEIGQTAGNIDWSTVGKVFEGLAVVMAAVLPLAKLVGETASWAGVGKLEGGLIAIGAVVTTILGFAWLDSAILSSTMKKMLDTVNTLGEIADGVNDLNGKSVHTNHLKSLFEHLSETFSMLKPTYGGGDGIGNISEGQAKEMANTFESLASILRMAKSAISELAEIEGANFDVLRTGQKIQNIITEMGTLYQSLMKWFGSDMTVGYSGIVTTKGVSKNDTKSADNALSIFNDLSEIIGKLKTVNKNVNKLSNIDTETFEANMMKARDIISMVATAWDDLNSGKMLGKFSGAGTTAENVQGVIDTFKGFQEVMKQIRYLMTDPAFAGYAGSSDPFSRFSPEKIHPIATNIGTAVRLLNNMGNPNAARKKVEQAQEMFEALQNMLTALSGMTGLEEGGEATTAMAGQIETLTTSINAIIESINNLTSVGEADFSGISKGIDAIGKSSDDSKKKVDKLIETLEKLSGMKPSVTVNAYTGTAMASLRSVKSMLDVINGFTASASVVVRRAADDTRSFADNVKDSLGLAKGGEVQYRAKGGELFAMRPKGTDTVPAMLSPGEFVQRKKAVDTFGIDFMRKVNGLNIHGAMDALQTKIGRRVNPISNVTTNNYYYNNNAKVTQTIHTNDASFAFRRANRYVGAL